MSGQRSLRRRLTRRLVGLGLVSVILLAIVNLVAVYTLLQDGTRDQLSTLRELRADTVEQTIDSALGRVSVMGTDPGVAVALTELADAYRLIDDDIDDDQRTRLTESYASVTDRYDAVEAPRPSTDELVPDSAAGRYVQYHYVADNDDEPRAALDDAGDGSAYSEAHATHHPFLRDLAASIGGGSGDLLLVDIDTLDVVYSVSKRIDLGTDVLDGPFADTGLGVVLDKLTGTAVEASTMSDTSFYLPDSSAPVVHIATTVRSNAEVVGVIVIVVTTELLTDIVTSGQNWELLGLGDTGDAYLVGADRTLRTIPRSWFSDPDEYLDRYLDVGGDERAAELMQFTGSPVLLQTVDNPAVDAALEGEAFIGGTSNYLDRGTLTAAAPVRVDDLGWVVITEQQVSESRQEVEEFVVAIAIVLAILLSTLVVIGLFLARVLTRPVRPLVAAAGRIADGDYHTEVPDLGRNELGDVGRQLESVAARLREQEAAIEQEESRINEMLATVLPPALVDRVRGGERELAEVVDTATVVAVSVHGIPAPSGADQDAVVELTTRLADESARVAQRHGVERAQAALEHQLYVTGRDRVGIDAARALSFAREIVATLPQVAAEFGVTITVGAGLSSGLVATGVLGSHQVAFGVWGTPVGDAIALSDRAEPGQARADTGVVDELPVGTFDAIDDVDDEWTLSDDVAAPRDESDLAPPTAGGRP